jgi:hypothetical protein
MSQNYVVVNTVAPSVLTTATSGVGDPSKFLATGFVTNNGYTSVTDRGFYYNHTGTAVTTGDTKYSAGSTGTGSYSVTLTGLSAGYNYNIKAYATNAIGTTLGNQMTQATATIAVGNHLYGGLIYYIATSADTLLYKPGEIHGLIYGEVVHSATDLTPGGGSSLVGATGTTIGSGSANTFLQFSARGAADTAARYVTGLTTSGYTDWFIPSQQEMQMLFNYSGQTLFNGYYLWCSTEASATQFYVTNPWQGTLNLAAASKGGTAGVFAIRYF